MSARRALALLLLCIAASARAAGPPAPATLRADRVTIAYVPPVDAAHRTLYDTLRQRRVLERFRAYFSPLRLPGPLRLRTASCDGEANAWYDEAEHEVTVCYEYFAEALRHARAGAAAPDATPEDAVLGPGVEVFLHEVAHAIFHLLRVPILGREEDAADQVAAYLMLRLDTDMQRRTVATVARMYDREAKRETTEREVLADVHGLSAQRLYNLLCLAYGADPVLFGDVLERGYLPADRAENCGAEYRQVEYAIKRLIEPYLDRAVMKRVQPRKHLHGLRKPAAP